MSKYISPEDFRVNGENAALYGGFFAAAVILFFLLSVSFGLVLIALGILAIVVWIKQGQLLGNSAKVSPQQFPNVYAISKQAADRLGMHIPDVFVRQDPVLNAFALGFLVRKSVILNSATVESMTDKELQFIIGHEFSHIKCGHTNLAVLTNAHNQIRLPIFTDILNFLFNVWSRRAEYTCDRGGVLANRDLKSAISAICKVAVGPKLVANINIDDLINQSKDIDSSDVARIAETFGSHPYIVKRISALERFFESNRYARLTAKNPDTVSRSMI